MEKVFKDNNTEIEFQSNLSRLLSHKVNHNFQDASGWTVIHYAALLGSQKLVVLFIRLGGKVKSDNTVPLKAVKKFSPMLKNLPKLTEDLKEETLLNKIEILTSQIKRDFLFEK